MGGRRVKVDRHNVLASCTATHSSITCRFSHCHGWDWCDLGPVLSYVRLLCEYILALYLTPQRCTAALPKSHRWAAVHLLCVPAGDAVYSKQGLGLIRTHMPRMLPQLCGTWCQDQLSCLCTGHLPAPAVTLKVREHAERHLQGFFICFFSYWYWKDLVLICLQVWMREIQCSFSKDNTAQLHQTTLERHRVASVDWLVQVMSWEGPGVSKGKIHPSGITCMRAHDF